MTEPENNYNKLRRDCWDKALDCFGYSYIFAKRVVRLRRRIRLLTAFGILVPVAAGAIALSYAYRPEIVDFVVKIVATPLMIAQLLVSIAALIYRWDDGLSYALDAASVHGTLSGKYKKLASTPPTTEVELQRMYDLLEVEYDERTKQDAKESIKEWENRMGMRAALREFQRKCVGCDKTPTSLRSTNCDVCGNYSFKNKLTNT